MTGNLARIPIFGMRAFLRRETWDLCSLRIRYELITMRRGTAREEVGLK